MALGYKKFLKVFLLVVVALATGFAVGKIYVDSIVPEQVNNFSDDYLMSVDEAKLTANIQKMQGGADPTQFNAMELYQLAEYNLNNAETFYKVGGGKVDTIISQTQKSEKIKVGDVYVYNKMSPGTVSICSQVVYNAAAESIKVNNKGKFVDGAEIQGTFDEADFVNWSLEDYKANFNTEHPEYVLPYVISSTTCGQQKFTPVSKTAEGDYKFEIVIDGVYLTLAATRYSAEIKYSSNLSDPPIWKSLKMTVVVDSSFNFVSIGYVESYAMKYGPLTPTVTDYFTDMFYFGEDVPPISQVLGREVA